MDFACCLHQQPNVFIGGRSSLLNLKQQQLRFRGRVVSSIVCLSKKRKKNTVSITSLSLKTSLGYLSVISRKFERLQCQENDSLAYIDEGNGRNSQFEESSDEEKKDSSSYGGNGTSSDAETNSLVEVQVDNSSLENLKELLQIALKELEVAQLNSTMFEDKTQKISEAAIALKDKADNAWSDVNFILGDIQDTINEEAVAKEAVQKATMALSMAEAKLQLAVKSLEVEKETSIASEDTTVNDVENGSVSDASSSLSEKEEALLVAQDEIVNCKNILASSEAELRRLQGKKEELQKEVDRLSEAAEEAQINALKAEEDVANIMLLAEQAVAFEVEAAKRVSDAEIALQRAEKLVSNFSLDISDTPIHSQILSPHGNIVRDESVLELEKGSEENADVDIVEGERERSAGADSKQGELLFDSQSDVSCQSFVDSNILEKSLVPENGKVSIASLKEVEVEVEKSKNVPPSKKQETQKERSKDSSPLSAPKLLHKSSRFFPASFFSSTGDGTEYTLASVLQSLIATARAQLPKLVLGVLLFGGGLAFLVNRMEGSTQLLQQPDVVTTSFEEVSSTAKPFVREIRRFPKRLKKLMEAIPHQEINEEEASLFDMLWLLLASVVFVPLFQKLPGGSPVLGYLAAGILIGPYGLSIIHNVHGTKAIAEFGVVFLLFNIGLELSVERLSSMKKYVFGLGSAQVLATAVVIGLVTHYVCGQPGPAAIVIGNGLALSSTAVVLQVLQERGESTSRHGRASFSVLLFQ
ncbi:K(+) efflux antiporter 2, chloroplastic-like, partial [Thalictrum thalictroides]